MMKVKPKKFLGQHFLNDETIAEKIVSSLTLNGCYSKVLEIGPGMGVLTKLLLLRKEIETSVIEIDFSAVEYLKNNFPEFKKKIIEGDFLEMKLSEFSSTPFAIIGNFPYNISTQILFKVYDNRQLIPEVVGMFQKEVAERIASKPGNKSYGILSVLMQAYYDIEYLFTVDEHVFTPPPKIKSGVIRLQRNKNVQLDCDEVFFKRVVKTAFNQRRKTLRNALKPITNKTELPFLSQRAEELSYLDFVELTNKIESKGD
ncbi:MAG: 16S rRNA (adenine(1518)-N(6)/adenine(1519)-N(6))-dimethyltransferase RsmA [Bacteroidota bacterium]